MRFRATPVNIPNTAVKPETADGTMPGTAWESRWLPELDKNNEQCKMYCEIVTIYL